MAANQSQGALSDTARGLMSDIERLLGQRLGQLKEDVLEELGKATAAGGSLGGGLGMTALGTLLGGLGVVHLLHKATGLPLWLCYAATSAAACGLGAGMLREGARQVSDLDLLPSGTGRVAGEVAQRAGERVAAR